MPTWTGDPKPPAAACPSYAPYDMTPCNLHLFGLRRLARDRRPAGARSRALSSRRTIMASEPPPRRGTAQRGSARRWWCARPTAAMSWPRCDLTRSLRALHGLLGDSTAAPAPLRAVRDQRRPGRSDPRALRRRPAGRPHDDTVAAIAATLGAGARNPFDLLRIRRLGERSPSPRRRWPSAASTSRS
jgi:hypothetical protein